MNKFCILDFLVEFGVVLAWFRIYEILVYCDYGIFGLLQRGGAPEFSREMVGWVLSATMSISRPFIRDLRLLTIKLR